MKHFLEIKNITTRNLVRGLSSKDKSSLQNQDLNRIRLSCPENEILGVTDLILNTPLIDFHIFDLLSLVGQISAKFKQHLTSADRVWLFHFFADKPKSVACPEGRMRMLSIVEVDPIPDTDPCIQFLPAKIISPFLLLLRVCMLTPK